MNMDAGHRKPKLVFFQWDHQPNADAASYLLLHMQQHVKCLATHFEVVVVNQDCDYAAICDRHQPDLTLFESGYRSHGSRRTIITNTAANAKVPKLGLHNADPWCDRRAGFLSDMERWGIETYFSISTMMPDYTPEIAASLFIWPNFIDPELYHDYGQHKTIPVTLTGQIYGLYPWRQQIFPLIRERYPCLVSPQHDYASKRSAGMLAGEAYARALNASFIVPTCGTQGGEVVRKHFEIPGAKACLLTERTPALEAAGFLDMENCVFASHHDVTDRIDHLFAHPDEMQRITQAGHELVHARHTLKHRPQIHQWYMLNRDLQPGEKIIQSGPFGDLEKVTHAAGRDSIHISGSARDRALLARGDIFLKQGRLAEARQCYAQCLDYVSYLPEAQFRLALCALHEGNADQARESLARLIEITTLTYGAADPDPVEWAYFLLSMICTGELGQARRIRDFYPGLGHEELVRARHVLDWLADGVSQDAQPDHLPKHRKSIHRLESRPDGEWLAWFATILDRCRQPELAARLRDLSAASLSGKAQSRRTGVGAATGWRNVAYAGADRLIAISGLGALRPNVPPMAEFRYFERVARNFGRNIFRGRLRPLGLALSRLATAMREVGPAERIR
ncbi:MAG TPA: glycosyltransferase, partial [Mesorhizobium sp.]